MQTTASVQASERFPRNKNDHLVYLQQIFIIDNDVKRGRQRNISRILAHWLSFIVDKRCG